MTYFTLESSYRQGWHFRRLVPFLVVDKTKLKNKQTGLHVDMPISGYSRFEFPIDLGTCILLYHDDSYL